MTRKLLIATACIVALGACGKQEKHATSGGEAAPAVNTASADPNVGVSSKGETFPTKTSTDSQEGASRGAEGSGAADQVAPESREALDALLALKPLETVSPNVILGADDRRLVRPATTFPERAQVLIALPGGRCSGTLVGKDLVLTAGHCVHGGKGGAWMTGATVYPGRDGRDAPYGACSAVRFYSVMGWTQDGNANYDIGAIKLNCDIGQRTGWTGVFWQSASLMGKSARISGYPGDKPLEQWTHTDQVRGETALMTSYATDTMPGNSGSGVLAIGDAPAGCGGPCVHTVHTRGDGGPNPQRNHGTRITQPLFNNIVQWISAPK
jgi:glutamyl endopeptidase